MTTPSTTTSGETKVVLYDGDCGFCNANITAIWKHDPEGIYSFASIQSELGRKILKEHDIHDPKLDTFYMVDGCHIYMRSDAAIRVIAELPGYKPLSMALSMIPSVILDMGYNFIARHRKRLMRNSCSIPPDEIKKRFL